MAWTKGIHQYLCPRKNVTLNSKSISNPVAHYIMNTHIHFCQDRMKTPLQLSRDWSSHFQPLWKAALCAFEIIL